MHVYQIEQYACEKKHLINDDDVRILKILLCCIRLCKTYKYPSIGSISKIFVNNAYSTRNPKSYSIGCCY